MEIEIDSNTILSIKLLNNKTNKEIVVHSSNKLGLVVIFENNVTYIKQNVENFKPIPIARFIDFSCISISYANKN